jgi:apolipoprotein N-acyltransferase
MGRFQIFFKKYWLAIFSGILMGTSYLPFPAWAIIFCFGPLWFVVLKSKTAKEAFWQGWWAQFVFTLIGFHWIAYVSHEFGYMPWAAATAVLLLFAATVHSYFAFASLACWYLFHRRGTSAGRAVLSAVFLVTLAETWWPSLFPWNMGYTLLDSSFPLFQGLAQWADIWGFWGLSLFIHLGSGLVALLLLSSKSKPYRFAMTVWALSFVILSLSGNAHLENWQESVSGKQKSLKTLIVQANIGNLEKVYAERGEGYQQEIAQKYFGLTRKGLQEHPEVDLIVWPESAFPDFLDTWNQYRLFSRQFYSFSKEIQKPILTGAFSADRPGPGPRFDYNGMFLFENGLPVADAYHKTYLLAYGEYTPGARMFPWLGKISPAGIGFGDGPGPSIFNLHQVKLGLQICYESLYPQFTSSLVAQKADVLINITNDSWFGPGFEPKQHMVMSAGRALEARRPLIRSTNTGISTVIQATGKWLEVSPNFTAWTGVFDVIYGENLDSTFYSRFGIFYPWILAIVLLILNFESMLRPSYKKLCSMLSTGQKS